MIPVIFKFLRLVWRLTFDKRVSLLLRALVPLAVLYAISPVDFLRDAIPIVGRFDDLLVLAMAGLMLTKLSPQHVIDEHMGKTNPSDRPEDKDPDKVVDGSGRLLDE